MRRLILINLLLLVAMVIGLCVEKPEQEVIIIPESTPITTQEAVAIEVKEYLDIPLSHELQDFTKNQCEYMGVPYEIVIAIMAVESGFQTDVISRSRDVGIMQINEVNHPEMERLFGFTDMLNAEDNIVSGIYMLSELYNKYSDTNKVLMSYNMGEAKAKKLWAQGIYETDYTIKVVANIL